jgi:hypothetical protein
MKTIFAATIIAALGPASGSATIYDLDFSSAGAVNEKLR